MSDEDDSGAETSGWRLVGSANSLGASVGRRRTFSERGSPRRLLADEQGRTTHDGRKSVENVSNISSSAPNVSSPFRSAAHLSPVREASGDVGQVSSPTNVNTAANARANTNVNANANVNANVDVRSGAGAGQEPSGGSESTEGEGGGSAEGGATSKDRGRRAKFDDEQIAKNQETMKAESKESRGRPTSKGFFSVRRSRTVEGTTSNSSSNNNSNNNSNSNSNAQGSRIGLERHVLKKRNSRGEVEKVANMDR
jgi:hypothetical protein